jgi:hypothetical protein
MATDSITPETVETSLTALFTRAEQERQVSLQHAAEVGKFEAQTLRQEQAILLRTLPADHPRVLALERMARGAEEVATWAGETVERSNRHPDVRPGDWVVLGRVVAVDGKAAPGLLVRIFDREQKFAQRLGQSSTDTQGEFFFRYDGEEFADLFKAKPALFLMVTDASRKTPLFTSSEAFFAEPGRVEQFEIHLSASVPSPTTGGGGRPRRGRTREG